MRIVIFAPHFAEYSSRLAHALGARDEILLINEKDDFEAECRGLDFAGVPPRLSRKQYVASEALGERRLPRYLNAWRVRRAIKSFKPHIIHIQEQGDDFTVAIAQRFMRLCPLVLTVHDPVPHSGNDALVALRFASGLAKLRTAATAYHVHGVYCENLLRKKLETSKPIAVTGLGQILVPSPTQARAAEKRFLFFGRMEAYKGLETFLDAIDLLPRRGDVRFILAGRGAELDRLRHRIAANPEIEVIDKFLSPVEAISEFQRARAVVVPYKDATQSAVTSAAFGNGRAVIASRVGGLVDSVQDEENGLLVPPDDPPALAGAIERLYDDRTSEALNEGARRTAATRLSWDAIAAPLHDLYAQLHDRALKRGRSHAS